MPHQRGPVTAVDKEFQERRQAERALRAKLPSLYLHVYANFSGVHLHAYVDWMTDTGRLHRLEIQKATWRPAEVTPEKVVEWGARALAAWLAQRAEDEGITT